MCVDRVAISALGGGGPTSRGRRDVRIRSREALLDKLRLGTQT